MANKDKKTAQEIQDEIFRKMSFEEKLGLASKLNCRIFRTIRNKIKSRYPGLDLLSLAKKSHKEFSLNRQYYDKIGKQFLAKELKYYETNSRKN